MLKRSVCLPAHMWDGLREYRRLHGTPASYIFRSLVDNFLCSHLDGYVSHRAGIFAESTCTESEVSSDG